MIVTTKEHSKPPMANMPLVPTTSIILNKPWGCFATSEQSPLYHPDQQGPFLYQQTDAEGIIRSDQVFRKPFSRFIWIMAAKKPAWTASTAASTVP